MTEYIRVGKRGTVVIPAELRRQYGLDEGDMLAMEESGGGLLLKPVRAYETEVYTPERIAEFLLNNAVTAGEYDEALAEVRAMGVDPDTVPHQSRPVPQMERVFLDANVLVSAAMKPDSAIAGLWTLRGVRLLASPHVITEARCNVAGPETAERLEMLVGALAVLPREPADFPIPDDPGLPAKDRPVLLGAIAARADVLLTGDMMHFGPCFGRSFGGVKVLLPGEFLRRTTGG